LRGDGNPAACSLSQLGRMGRVHCGKGPHYAICSRLSLLHVKLAPARISFASLVKILWNPCSQFFLFLII
jgi:hypothetical protein